MEIYHAIAGAGKTELQCSRMLLEQFQTVEDYMSIFQSQSIQNEVILLKANVRNLENDKKYLHRKLGESKIELSKSHLTNKHLRRTVDNLSTKGSVREAIMGDLYKQINKLKDENKTLKIERDFAVRMMTEEEF